jgi:uncharacterized protein YodC (DUF2158 family)
VGRGARGITDDIVRLKSGGPDMIVERLVEHGSGEALVECQCFHERKRRGELDGRESRQ